MAWVARGDRVRQQWQSEAGPGQGEACAREQVWQLRSLKSF